MINLHATIPFALAGKRLDQVLTELFSDYSRSQLQKWIHQQQVLVDGQLKRPRDRLHGGENRHPDDDGCDDSETVLRTILVWHHKLLTSAAWPSLGSR